MISLLGLARARQDPGRKPALLFGLSVISGWPLRIDDPNQHVYPRGGSGRLSQMEKIAGKTPKMTDVSAQKTAFLASMGDYEAT